jgi:GrpB-like predicted nucleotidyltransferase (UPF0157 family)
MQVRVTPPDAAWPAAYAQEAARISTTLGSDHYALHHIGSTSIPGIYAKPVIDMLMVAPSLALLDAAAPAMAALGYEVMGEFGIVGRRYFRRDSPERLRLSQVHGFTVGSFEITRHLAFRDYMRTHPHARAAYSDLKRELALAHPDSMEAYMDGKDGFVKAQEALALEWLRTR